MKQMRTMCRKWTVFLLIFVLLGCGRKQSGKEQPKAADADDRLRIVTTIFPYYDFVRQIAGDQVELTLIVPAGMDSHSFEPTPADMRMIQNADVLICNGGAMEHWLEQVLDAVDTSAITVITLMDYVDTVREELVEGMEDAGHGDHGHEDHNHGTEEHEDGQEMPKIDDDGYHVEIEYDEHIWTSPVNAMQIVEAIRDVLIQNDPVHTDGYQEAAREYLAELKRIDGELRQISRQRRHNLIVVGDKFPFRYLAEEYGLDYRAAFSGCSTDTEPSARTIAYLIDKVQEKQIPVVYYLELSSTRVAEIISEETGAQPLLLHSCHNVTRRQFDTGITYLELMEQNVENLRKGLDE